MLIARNLVKRFGTVTAVESVSLNVASGESYALLGPDGAGKTTLIRLLCGLYRADEGSADIGGIDVSKRPTEAHRLLGYMPQQFSLYPTLSILENIAFFARLYQVDPRAPFIAELLESSRLTAFRNRAAGRLSGGMKQKLALICAILHRPPLLLLDEPTTGVDPVSRRDFWAILYSLLAAGTTLLISTPYMDEAERCNRVGFLSQGRLIAESTPERLKSDLSDEVVEIACDRPPLASRILREMEGVLGVQVFTDRVRVLASRVEEESLRSLLVTRGFTVSRIERVGASMEDVFIASVVRDRRNG